MSTPPPAAVAPPFDRTPSCSCSECVACCHRQPGPLAPGDLDRIADHLQLPIRVASLKFWASGGARVGNRLTGETWQIGSITPRMRGGRCIFLDAQDRCTIHPVAPFGCAYFDTHMDALEGHRRGSWLAVQQQDPEYQSLRRTLVPAASYKPSSY